MILARPTRSLIRFIQMVGRVLRPAPGKTNALLLDHSGSTARLGHPCDDLPLELDDGKPRDASSQKAETREAAAEALPEMQVHARCWCSRMPEMRVQAGTPEHGQGRRR